MMVPPISPAAAVRRARTLAALRGMLDGEGFLEITTPVLLTVRPGGPDPAQRVRAAAMETDLDLRTSIELLLRTALPAAERVYDIGPAIRLEDSGKPARSAVEFTLLELYIAGVDYAALMAFAERLLRAAVPTLPEPRHVSVAAWFAAELGIDFGAAPEAEIRRELIAAGGGSEADRTHQLVNKVVGDRLEKTLEGFVFLTDYPTQTVCLARRRDDAPHLIERFEVFIDDLEIGHGFIDAMDADDVLTRMHHSGPEHTDRAFVDRLKAGHFPASGGFGLGLERLLAATDDAGPRDVRRFIHAYQHG